MAVYQVTKTNGEGSCNIRAKTKQQALAYVARTTLEARQLFINEIIVITMSGGKIEDATAEPVVTEDPVETTQEGVENAA